MTGERSASAAPALSAGRLEPSSIADAGDRSAGPRPNLPGPRAVFVGSAQFRRPAYGTNHPLAIPRVALALDLVRAYGAIAPGEFVEARKAADFELEWFHTREYVAAIRTAEALGRVRTEWRERFGLGTLENPFFPEIFSRPALATGGSIQAAEQVLAGRVAFSPAGGMHHARPDRARGFCYFNDPVLAVIRLRRAGLRVLYVDLDAHHCDGVEEALSRDPDVLTLSLHMNTAYAYPNAGGRIEDWGAPDTGHTTINVPLPRGVGDAEYRLVFDAVWLPAVERFRPDAIVLQAGTDAIGVDPLGKLRLSTQGFLAVARTVLETAPRHPDGTPRLMATGGGGYHPLVVARAWAGLWAILSGRELEEAIPAAGTALLRAVPWEHDEEAADPERLYLSRTDAPADGSIRDEVRALVARAATHPFFASWSR
jgi:acetoin utilization protein AcuC